MIRRPFPRHSTAFNTDRSMKHLQVSALALLLGACAQQQQEVVLQAEGPARDGTGVDLPTDAYERSTAEAQEPAPEPAARFHDGDRQRELFLAAGLLAEMNPTEEGSGRLLGLRPEAVEVSNDQSAVRLWQIEGDPLTAAAELTDDTTGFSPVFHEGAKGTAARCALSGGVTVRFTKEWTDAQITAFLADEGLAGERIGSLGTTWLVESAPGLSSVELANRLHDLEGTEYATPNLWREVSTR